MSFFDRQAIFADGHEVRHFVATYALYQIAGHKSMRHVLPPGYRDYWTEQEEVALILSLMCY